MNPTATVLAPFRRRIRFILAGCIAAALGAPAARAQSGSWNVDAAGAWNLGTNWTPGVPGATTGTTNTGIATFGFTLAAPRIVTVDANRNIAGITFGNTSAFGYTLSGGAAVPLLLTSGGVIQNLSSTGNHTNTVNAPVIIQVNNGTAAFTANASSSTSLLVIGPTPVSGVSTNGNTTTLTLNGTNTATGNSVGILNDGTAGGKLALTKDGAGTWTIGIASNSSTFTGGITINAGTLRGALTSSGQAFGAANAITLANTAGAILNVNAGAQSIGSLAGGGSSGGNVILGAIVLTLGLNNSNTSYAGALSGTGGIIKVGTGTQTFTGSNLYTGSTRLNGGTLALDFSAANAPATNMIAPTSVLNLAGGTLSLTGKANTINSQPFASATLTAGGASAINLTADLTANPLVVTIGAITRGAGSTLDVTLPADPQSATNGIRTTTTNMRNNVLTNSTDVAYATAGGNTWASVSNGNLVSFTGTYNTGNGNYSTNNNIDVTNGDSVSGVTVNTLRFNGNNMLTLAGTNTVATGGILITSAATNGATITGGTLQSSGTADALTLINNGTQLTVDSVITNNGANPTVLTLSGAGTTILNAPNTYTGATYITGGTVRLGNASGLGVAGAVTFGDRAAAILDVNGLSISLASLAGGGNQGAIGFATVGTTGGTVALGTQTLTLGTTGSGISIFGGSITGTSGSLVKVGTNVQQLMGANSLTGGVTIKAGTLTASGVTGNNALGSGTITLGDSAGGNAPATLRVGNAFGNVGNYIYTNPIVLASNTTGVLEVNSLASSGGMDLRGGVTGSNNFSINSATSGGGTVTFSTNPINNAGTLTIGGAITANNIAITGGIGSNVTNVSLIRNNVFFANNGITISTTAVNNNGTISNTGTQAGPQPQVNTISAPIGTNVTGIIQNSTDASLILSGTNTFTAPITVSAGSLTLSGNNQAAGISSAVSLANFAGAQIISTTSAPNFGSLAGGGTTGGNVNLNSTLASTLTVGSNNTSTTYSGVIGGMAPSVALTKVGTGTLTLSGTNNYTGATAVNAGTLVFARTSAKAAGTATAGASGSIGLGVGGAGFYSSTNVAALFNTNTLTGFSLNAASGVAIDTTNAGGPFDQNTALTAARALTKLGTGTLTLSQTNTYTGPTTVNAGTLEVSGSLTATTSVSVTSGTLLLAGASESINDAASLGLSLGTTLAFANSLSSRTETFNSLNLLGNAILDFGDGNTNRFAFTSGISGLTTRTLSIYNWSGPAGAGTQDILALSNTLSDPELNNISFYSGAVGSEATTFLGTGGQISFGGPAFELVPIPEPSSTAMVGAAALLGLIGFRERKRLIRAR